MADGSAGVISRILEAFPVSTVRSDEQMLENVRSALGRGLPVPKACRPHDRLMSVAAGGPSLADTWKELQGDIVAVNGSLRYLLEKDVTPWAVGCMDPRPHMADTLEARDGVFYFIGSTCHPDVFEKLKNQTVILWHPLGMDGLGDVIGDRPGIGGGTTMGLRWLTLGHYMGFRKFHCHGLDSSFRGRATHAYPDWRDNFESQELFGFRTSLNFIQQVSDWFELKILFQTQRPEDQAEVRLLGDGLLQHCDAQHEQLLARLRAIPARNKTETINVVCVNTGNYLGRGEEYVAKLKAGIEKHYSSPLRFHVVTEGPASWWAKLQLFQPGRFPEGERCVYFDLDTLITGSLDDILSWDGPFMAIKNWWQKGQLSSGFMSWTAGEADHIWTEYEKAGCPTDDPRGDQAWIASRMPNAVYVQDMFPNQLFSFKANCLSGVPENARVVCFHGEPRPHETKLWTN